MEKKQSQLERVLLALKKGGWVSTVDAVRGEMGEPILRLGARIYDLRGMGFDIEERKVEGKTYSEYRLKNGNTEKVPTSGEGRVFGSENIGRGDMGEVWKAEIRPNLFSGN